MRLNGKSVVITGASSGMGKAMVELFVKEGANVVAVARRKERLEELKESLKNEAGKVEIFPGDVSIRENNEKMIDFAVEKFGRLDVLVNNAGVVDDMSPIGEMTDENYEKLMTVNTYGPMCAMRKAVNVFLKQESAGSIVNIASIGAQRVIAGPAYCASKAALVSISKNTAYMYAPQKIRCNVIEPGAVMTEINNAVTSRSEYGYERVKRVMATMPGFAAVNDIANLALFLASDESASISGDIMNVDCGWCAG